MYTHILLEVYCEWENKKELDMCDLPCGEKSENLPTYQCLFNRCPYVAFTSCENTLCYIGKNSEAEELISFGGEMGDTDLEISEWEKICADKINEAYDEYMRRKHLQRDDRLKY